MDSRDKYGGFFLWEKVFCLGVWGIFVGDTQILQAARRIAGLFWRAAGIPGCERADFDGGWRGILGQSWRFKKKVAIF